VLFPNHHPGAKKAPLSKTRVCRSELKPPEPPEQEPFKLPYDERAVGQKLQDLCLNRSKVLPLKELHLCTTTWELQAGRKPSVASRHCVQEKITAAFITVGKLG